MCKVALHRRSIFKRTASITRLLMLATLFCCCAWPHALNATLIVVLRHNNDLYVASDSVLSRNRQKISEKHIKCFPASETSCVAISGYGGGDGTVQTTSNRLTFDLHFPQKLEGIAAEEYAKDQLFSESATNILDHFSSVYKSLMVLFETNGYDMRKIPDETDIYFFGYDSVADAFYQLTARFPPVAPYNFDLEKEPLPGSSIGFFGESRFLAALMRGDDPRVKALQTKALSDGLNPSPSTNENMQEKAISAAILNLYALHIRYARSYNYNDGMVGPPYAIYRISTNSVTRIYYGNGFPTSDESLTNFLLCAVVAVLIVSVIIFALRS
jgi:hypothetical protein